jgi:hypothetical protein
METKQQKFVTKALTKMFEIVGRTYTPEAVGHPDWFYENSWTGEQEAEFREWLARLYSRTFYVPVKKARLRAGMFLLYYGWKIEDLEPTPRGSKTQPGAKQVAGRFSRKPPRQRGSNTSL